LEVEVAGDDEQVLGGPINGKTYWEVDLVLGDFHALARPEAAAKEHTRND